MVEESWTILKLLNWTTDYFKKHDVAEPRSSAEVLLAHVLSQDRLFLYLNYDRPMEPQELSAYRVCIKRRLAGEPSQYITGTQEFWSLPLRVSPEVLIPRPETEVLVEAVLNFVHHNLATEANPSILDLGTGSGAIAIALARELPEARIMAVDLSAPALQLARKNAQLNQVDRQLHFVQSDIFSGIPGAPSKFSVIVSNPPYVSHSEFDKLASEIREFEPRGSLDGGPDGLAAIRRIVMEAPAVLRPRGGLLLEMGADQAETVSMIVSKSQKYNSFRILKDYSGLDRVLVAVKGE
jgi:release factor glutamine methyltransferase